MQAVHKVFSSLFLFRFSIWAERWSVWAARKANSRSTARKVRTLTLKHPPLETPQHKLAERKWEPEHVNHNKCVFMWHSTCYTSQSFCLFILPYSSQNCVCAWFSLCSGGDALKPGQVFQLRLRSWLGIHYMRLQKPGCNSRHGDGVWCSPTNMLQ